VWLPKGTRIPDGMRARCPPCDSMARRGGQARPHLSCCVLASLRPFGARTRSAPRPTSARPSSFAVDRPRGAPLLFASDVDVDRTAMILRKQSVSSWQRAAHLLHCGQLTPSISCYRPRTKFYRRSAKRSPTPSLFAPQFRMSTAHRPAGRRREGVAMAAQRSCPPRRRTK
jgi:hypothetical protein